MRPFLRFIFLTTVLFAGQQVFSQQPEKANTTPRVITISKFNNRENSSNITAKDVCNNGIDDDLNGLIDEKDFSCYYESGHAEGCLTSHIIWTCNGWSLHWADTETGEERYVGDFDRLVDDIAWGSNGKLYAVVNYSNEIFEVDPYTAALKPIGAMPGYYSANGLTCDLQGNLYVAAVRGNSAWDIVKFNLASGTTVPVANLAAAGMASGGDLTFLNGFLYVAGDNSRIAKVNHSNGAIEIHTIVNTPTTIAMGLITMGDGYLYICNIDDIYRIDPVTMTADAAPYYTFQWPNILMRGLANYTEHCNGPGCKAKVDAVILSTPPYCAEQTVWIKGIGSGINGQSEYTWTLPDGSKVKNDSLQVQNSGRYVIKYHTVPDTCGAESFIDIAVSHNPKPFLGNDTIFCIGTSFTLAPKDPTGIKTYLWNQGSTSPSINISGEGIYWLQASNECGSARDSIIVSEADISRPKLGEDTSLCPGSSVILKNLNPDRNGDLYYWSNGSTQKELAATGGLYWLSISNVCGTSRDSIIVAIMDSCTCFPLFPEVDLGADREICAYESITVRNLKHNDRYQYVWNNGERSSELVINKPGTYILQAGTYCGQVSDTLVVKEKNQDCEQNIFVPRAFTPNNDGINDIFQPIIRGVPSYYTFSIYNRWGQQVFYTRNTSLGWSGIFNGHVQDSGVYVWRVDFQFPGQNRLSQKGTVALLR